MLTFSPSSYSFGFIGRNLGISLGGSVFGNMIQVNLHKYAPGLPSSFLSAIQNNADAVYTVVPEQYRPQVLKAYVKTLSAVFLIGVPASIIALAGSLIMEDVKMELNHAPKASGAKDVEQGSTATAPPSVAAALANDNESKTEVTPNSDAGHGSISVVDEDEKVQGDKVAQV